MCPRLRVFAFAAAGGSMENSTGFILFRPSSCVKNPLSWSVTHFFLGPASAPEGCWTALPSALAAPSGALAALPGAVGALSGAVVRPWAHQGAPSGTLARAKAHPWAR